MATTTYWTWTVEFDEPGTGRRVAAQGETIAPPSVTHEEVRQRLYPELTEELQRRYGAGYCIEGLAPACRFDQK
ncbi:hypothetical protein ACPXCP_39850 [Streptomyces sp. DT20]|uniref:hypothetical protein n=1 Tax=Streptomyces sp. DT20 TaxID=3416519 RepID=UPI003CF46F2D